MATLQRSAFLEAIQKHDPQSTAVVHSLSGRSFTYGSLLRDVSAAKERLLSATGKNESNIVGERIAFLVENGYDYVGAVYRLLTRKDRTQADVNVQSHFSPVSHRTP